MLQVTGVRDSSMQSYYHYSGFIVKASELNGIKGINYLNGWIINRTQYTPWYLQKSISHLENLETEMSAFCNNITMDEDSGIPHLIVFFSK